MALLELAEDIPRRRDRDQQDAKVESDRDKVVGVSLRLHAGWSERLGEDCKTQNDSRPSDSLAQRLDTSEDTGVVGERGEVGGVLTDEPVEELLEGLSTKRPKEDESVSLAESALAEVEQGGLGGVVELVLEDDGPDPSSGEENHNAALVHEF